MRRSLLAIALFAFACSANAAVYKWIDADGKTQYGDAPPKNSNARVVTGGVTVVPATVVPQAAPTQQSTPQSESQRESGGAAQRSPNAASSEPKAQPATPVTPPLEAAAAARAEARAKAIERCRNNRGVDCENEADGQFAAPPSAVYVPGTIPGWSQPPIRPAQRQVRPSLPPSEHPHKQAPKRPSSGPRFAASAPVSETESRPGIKPMR